MAPNIQSIPIPAATVQSHASNLAQLPDKTLLCTWFGGSQEGLPDISIWLSRLEPGSSSWTSPKKISYDENRSCQNPVLFRAPDSGEIWLLHTSQDAGNQDGAYILVRKSSDGGITWSEADQLLPGKTGIFTRQPIVVLKDGTWVLPVFYCRGTPGHRWIGNDDISELFYTQDGGKTWSEKQFSESSGAVHMNIVPQASEQSPWVAFYRSRWADNVYRSTSKNGLEWAKPEALTLPNPNSGICAARLRSGKLVIVFNRSAASPDSLRREGLYDDITPEDDKRPNQVAVGQKSAIWGTPRKTLTVGVSDDDGLTWTERVLEDGDGFCGTNSSTGKENRELSYPSILVQDGDGPEVTHIAFTFHRQFIKYVRIEEIEEWVKG
ncbi:hypothetical protein CEP54_012609 [Fusarium duplospermum]|uniref:Sialidase domain-containing protein n=1 Tax=Fusarium duplospermum TaxID=1325734 RepID=A0A428P7Q1_9HYPO|nr:hypothetical protein CEP54_012609 [Fusarium duplospermum]